MRLSCLLFALLVAAGSCAAQEPLLHAPFDGSDDASLRGDPLTPYATHAGPYVIGLRGQARLLGGMNRLSYFTNEGFYPPEGSCSLWVQPRDWPPDAPHFVFFASFTLTEADNKYVRAILYKMYNGSDVTVLIQDTREGNKSARIQTPMTGWEIGQWHHLALVWDADGYELFVDGESAGTCASLALPDSGRWEIAVGTPYQGWAYLGKEKSAIDEFTVWPRRLTAAEVREQYQTTLAAAPPDAFEMPDTSGGMPAIEGNLALDGNGAFALAQSFADYEAHYPDNLVDGRDDTAWAPLAATLPQWLEVRWTWPVRANEVILRQTEAGHVGRMIVYAWVADEWLPVAEATGDERDIAAGFDEVTTDRIRVVITEGRAEGLEVSTLAVRGPEQVLPATLRNFVPSEQALLVEASVTPEEVAPGDEVTVRVRLRPQIALTEDHVFLLSIGDASREPRWSNWHIARAVMEPDTPTSQWLPGEEQTLAATVHIPGWAPDGPTQVRLAGPGLDSNAALATIKIARFDGPAPAGLNATGIEVRNGSVALRMGEETVAPMAWSLTLPSFERFDDYSGTGVRLYHVKSYPLRWDDSPETLTRTCGRLDESIRALLRVDRGAQIIVDLDLRPTPEWLEANPGERLLTAQGQTGPVCYSSRSYVEGVLEFTREIIRYFKAQAYYDHIAGYLPMSCGTPDSAMGGAEGNLFQLDRSKINVGDYNPQAIAAFREWLREKYAGSEADLRAAWRDETLSFETATPVIEEIVREGVDGGVFRDPLGSAMTFDYAEWLSGVMGRFYCRVMRAIKQEAGRPVITGTYYGYNVAHLRGYNSPGTTLQNNNLDLPGLLDNPDWDYFAGPTPYSNRQPGSAYYSSFTHDSLRLHGKLLMGEIDHRTFIAYQKRYGRLRSDRHTEASLRRDMVGTIIDGAGYWFADWSRGMGRNAVPWFLDEGILRTIADTREVHERALARERRSVSQIAVFTSGQTMRYHDVYRASPIYHNLIPYTLWDAMGKIGAPYDIYAIEDLGAPEVQEGYRLYVFLNAFFLTPEQRAQIESLKRDGKTLLMIYAPGYVSREDGLTVAGIEAITGMSVAVKPERELMKYTVVTGEHPVVAEIEEGHMVEFVPYSYDLSVELHPPEIAPVFFVDDPRATTLARYPDGKVAVAARDFGDWRSVYCAVPRMDTAWLRGVARWADVHLYCDEDIVLKADSRLLMLHNGYKAERTVTIALPAPHTVAGEASFEVTLPAPSTMVYWMD